MLRLITDTAANLPQTLIERYDLRVVPLRYARETESGQEDLTDVPFDGDAFYARMREGMVIRTSMVSVGNFLSVFEPALEAGEDVVYIGVSGGISSTYETSMMAVQELRQRYPERKIAAINTRAASLGEGLPVLYAAQLRENGASFEELVRATVANCGEMCQYFTVDDLQYLRRGGRIPPVLAVLGNLLGIKPILFGDENGVITLHSKVRGEGRAISRLVEQYKLRAADMNQTIGIAHADNAAGAEKLTRELQRFGFSGEVLRVGYEPVTGSHVGPGALALFFYGDRPKKAE